MGYNRKPVGDCRYHVSMAAVLLAVGFSSVALSAPTFTERGSTLLGSSAYSLYSLSLADIDNDGDLDILYQGAAAGRRLMRNNTVGLGADSFTDITSGSGLVASDTAGWSAAWGDYDGDGDVDVFLGEQNPGSSAGDLFRNNGDSTFTNISSTTINDPGFHQNVGWLDADNDGDLDLFIGMEGPELHELYVQGPTRSFTQYGAQAGLQVPFGYKAYGSAIGDTDGDGYPEIYVSTCRTGGLPIRNNFFQNRTAQHGSIYFEDIADTNGTQFTLNSYGTEFVDFDDDGDLDLYMTGADTEASKIWRNDGSGHWTDVDTITGHPLLSDTGGDLNGSKAVDYDNDGDLDLYFHDNQPGDLTSSARSLYRNDGNWTFTNVTAAEGLFEANLGSYDGAWGDYDRDGDMDLIDPTNGASRERFFVSNASTNGNKWLQVRLKQTGENTTAIGAQVYATIHAGTPQQRTLRREANTNANTFNQSDVPVHFGLGNATIIDELKVRWPNGDWQILTDVSVNQYLTIIKGDIVASPTPSPSPSPSPSVSPTASLTPTESPTPSPSPSLTASPSPTTSETPSLTPSLTPTPSPTASLTPTASSSPTPSPSAVPSLTASPSPTASLTPTPATTLTATPTPSPTATAAPTVSPTPTATLAPSIWATY